MKYIVAGILLLFFVIGRAQLTDATTFAQTITASDLSKHLHILASPEMEGRETATSGLKKAADYIEQHFRACGLKGAWNSLYQQKFTVYQDSLVRTGLVINGNALRHDTDFAVSHNSGFNIFLSAGEVLFAGYGLSDSTRDDYKEINAKGKIVMVFPGAPQVIVKGKKRPGRVPDFYTLQDAAAKNGAAALLIIDAGFPRKPANPKGSMYIKDFRKENVPNTFFISDSVAGIIMGSDYEIAKKMMKKGVPAPKSFYVPVSFELEKQMNHLESSNVLGIFEGTEKKDEAVIITSHYDHLGKRDSIIYYGADDDGSGTSAILEFAEAFAKISAEGIRPKRSIVLMTVSGEEKGLWGSDYYSQNPVFPLDKTSVNINIDMIGRVESGRKEDSLNYIFVVGDNRLSSDLRTISEEVNTRTLNLTLDYKFNDPNDPQRIFYRSDHYNFAKNGVPAIFYFNGLHEDYHRPTDTPDKINYELLEKRARLIFYTAWEMANREEMLKRDIE